MSVAWFRISNKPRYAVCTVLIMMFLWFTQWLPSVLSSFHVWEAVCRWFLMSCIEQCGREIGALQECVHGLFVVLPSPSIWGLREHINKPIRTSHLFLNITSPAGPWIVWLLRTTPFWLPRTILVFAFLAMGRAGGTVHMVEGFVTLGVCMTSALPSNGKPPGSVFRACEDQGHLNHWAHLAWGCCQVPPPRLGPPQLLALAQQGGLKPTAVICTVLLTSWSITVCPYPL